MDARDCAYFANLARDKGMLKDHSFNAWPDAHDLTRYACGLEDGLQTLAGAFGMRLAKDIRGKWVIVAKDGEAV